MIPVIEPQRSAEFDWPSQIRAVSTTRAGGLSRGPYASLNLSTRVGDSPDAVAGNIRRLIDALALPAEPAWLWQVHGNTVVADPCAQANPPEADAAITDWTDQADCVLAIQTADCLPVVIAAADGSAAGVAHAGWRGLAAGVLGETVRALRAARPDAQFLAWLGPCIGPSAYEVDASVRAAVVKTCPEADSAFSDTRPDHARLDLQAVAYAQLTALGIDQVQRAQHCTYAEADRFFSYRRAAVTGRQATLAWLADR